MTRTFARGACPGLSAPMETGDGLLVRLLPVAPIALDALIGLCQAALRHGNGIMEISARGSLQIRGLTPASVPLLAAEIAGLGVEISEGVPVIADPLPDDPTALIDASAIAAALRGALAAKAFRLAPKVSVVIDGGGRVDLNALPADIRLSAVATPDGPRFRIGVAGNAKSATRLGLVARTEAVEAVLELLAQIAELGPEARGADLLDGPAFPQQDEDPAPSAPRMDVIGQHSLRDGALVLGVGLAFGHTEAGALVELAGIAKSHGADWARPAPQRALLLGPFGETNAGATAGAAERLGFVVGAHDPRRRIAACPGAPLCMHGLIAARTLAAEIAREVPLPAGDGIALHVSGCAKGCAYPMRAPLTVVGTEQGCGLIADGTSRARPTRHVPARGLISALTNKREPAHA
jgi:precorrin-3B synthase